MIWDIIFRIALLLIFPLLLIGAIFNWIDAGDEGLAFIIAKIFVFILCACIAYMIIYGAVKFFIWAGPGIKQFVLTGDM